MEIKKIYFDMDGVLADFDRGIIELCHMEPRDQYAPQDPARDDAMWTAIKEVGHYYDKLELMPGAKEMFDAVYGRYGDKCEILTGIPKPKRHIDTAAEDKIAWVRRLLSDQVKIHTVFRQDKTDYCTGPDCVLIDDYKINIDEWTAMGGTGILNTSAEHTLEILREMDII